MKKGSKSKIRILIVDDHILFRAGLKALLTTEDNRIEVVGSVGDGKQAVEFCKKNKVDIVLMDIEMPVMDGIEATQKIRLANPNQNILMLSMHDEEAMIVYCIEKGAKGFLSKNSESSEILHAIHSIAQHGYYFNDITSKAMVSGLLTKMKTGKEITALTDREIEVIKLISKEYTAKEIASKLSVSLRTVDNYRERILQKIGARNTVGMVMYAVKHNLID